jgi:hypothetical protein
MWPASPVCIQPSTIALAVSSGRVPITHHDHIATGADLTDYAARHLSIVLIDDPDFDTKRRPAARAVVSSRAPFAETLAGVQNSGNRRQLRLGVSLYERDPRQGCARSVEHGLADRRAAI